MKKTILPQKLSHFPIYIFAYWVVLWGIVLIFSLFQFSVTLTPDGKYVEKVDCTKYEEKVCVNYSSKYYVPAGEEAANIFVSSGIRVGIISLLVGYSWMLLKWKIRKKK